MAVQARCRSGWHLIAVVLVVLVASIAPASPAAAARLSVPDDRRDAVRAVDIARMVVDNGRAEVRVKARVPDFKPARTEVHYVVVRVRSRKVDSTEYTLIATSPRTATLWKVPFATEIPPGQRPVDCPGLTIKWVRSSRAVAVIPRSCLLTTNKVQAGVLLERVDATRPRHTDWAPGAFAQLGPIVRRG